MQTVKLNNGVVMPMLGYGTFKVSDTADCAECVAEAVQSGYRLIDTAQFYNNEEAVGEGIRSCGAAREELFITTKVWFLSYNDCRATVMRSMRKLGLEYLDLVLLHWPFGDTYAAWRDLEALYAEGKIRAIGVSNFAPARLLDFIRFQKVLPAVNQIETNLFTQRAEEQRWMEKYHIVHQAYMPLGRLRAAEMFAHPTVKAIAAAHGKTPAQVALRFLIQRGVSAVPKSATPARIRENLDIFDFELTASEMGELAKMDETKGVPGPVEDPARAESILKL